MTDHRPEFDIPVLDWTLRHECAITVAQSEFGEYAVHFIDSSDPLEELLGGPGNYFTVLSDDRFGDYYDCRDKAHEQCQADYERRVMEAMEPEVTPA